MQADGDDAGRPARSFRQWPAGERHVARWRFDPKRCETAAEFLGCSVFLFLDLLSPIIRTMNYRDYITIEPNKRGGKPCVRGLRITVYEVLEYLASEMTEEEILDDFPDLTREDLKACIAYAADRERRWMTAPLPA